MAIQNIIIIIIRESIMYELEGTKLHIGRNQIVYNGMFIYFKLCHLWSASSIMKQLGLQVDMWEIVLLYNHNKFVIKSPLVWRRDITTQLGHHCTTCDKIINVQRWNLMWLVLNVASIETTPSCLYFNMYCNCQYIWMLMMVWKPTSYYLVCQ